MKSSRVWTRIWALALFILAAAAFRLLPTPMNFSPIGAIALFAGFSFRNKWLAVVAPLVAMLLSDAVLGFHDLMWAVYLSLALTTALGFFVRDQKGVVVKGTAAVVAAVLFFVITNTAVWAYSGMYTRDGEGLITCFIAALPFLSNTIMGNLFFSAVLFAGWSFAEKYNPALRESAF